MPDEVRYLQQYDLMKAFVSQYIDMPDRSIDLLIRFLYQNKGVLSKRVKENEFSALTDNEIIALETKFQEISNDS